MKPFGHLRTTMLVCTVLISVQHECARARQPAQAASTKNQATLPERDGQHDFDFEIGAWKTHVSRLLRPLSASKTWADYDGTTIVRKVWNGRANLVELQVDGPAGRLELASLRLYEPQAHRWSLNVASSAGGTLGVPTIGGFSNGRGEFYDREIYNGRTVLVRFVISDIRADSVHFEQAFSVDDGKTWETNWIATDTRVKGEADPAQRGVGHIPDRMAQSSGDAGETRASRFAGISRTLESQLPNQTRNE
jgi:hypothetical protein